MYLFTMNTNVNKKNLSRFMKSLCISSNFMLPYFEISSTSSSQSPCKRLLPEWKNSTQSRTLRVIHFLSIRWVTGHAWQIVAAQETPKTCHTGVQRNSSGENGKTVKTKTNTKLTTHKEKVQGLFRGACLSYSFF